MLETPRIFSYIRECLPWPNLGFRYLRSWCLWPNGRRWHSPHSSILLALLFSEHQDSGSCRHTEQGPCVCWIPSDHCDWDTVGAKLTDWLDGFAALRQLRLTFTHSLTLGMSSVYVEIKTSSILQNHLSHHPLRFILLSREFYWQELKRMQGQKSV